jgi:hypothetical protein
MPFRTLVAWAWRETPPVHKSRANLLIHIFAVPLFVVGHVLFFAGIASGAVVQDWTLAIIGPICIVVSLVLQGIGHKLERTAAPRFLNPRDFIRRIYAEQFCNFWRFLFSGQWFAALKGVRG